MEKSFKFQMPEEDLVELKFRLYDGSDIGPFRYSPASTVAMLKERIVTEWPKGQTLCFHDINIYLCLLFFSACDKMPIESVEGCLSLISLLTAFFCFSQVLCCWWFI